MVIVNLKGGLGNQMFQYALGRALAIQNNSELKMDLTHLLLRPPANDSTPREYSLGFLNIVEQFASLTDRRVFGLDSLWGKVRSRVLRSKVHHERHFHFDPIVSGLSGDIYLDGYWQSPKYFESIEATIKKEFDFKNEIDKKHSLLAVEITTNESVCVHVRRTDYVSNPRTYLTHGVCSLEYYFNSIAYISSKISDFKVFVFSDDISWCRRNITIKHPHRFVGCGVRNNSFQEDFHLMSLCDHFIISNSTFSWWAAWLGKNPRKMVIAPSKWFNDPAIDTSYLIPRGWVRL